jgi:hypothetical protein
LTLLNGRIAALLTSDERDAGIALLIETLTTPSMAASMHILECQMDVRS